jgi:hypothetical protein
MIDGTNKCESQIKYAVAFTPETNYAVVVRLIK